MGFIDEDMRCVLMETLAYFQETRSRISITRCAMKGYLRHLLVRKAAKTGEILVDLVTSSDACFLQKDATEPATEVQAEPLMADAFRGT